MGLTKAGEDLNVNIVLNGRVVSLVDKKYVCGMCNTQGQKKVRVK